MIENQMPDRWLLVEGGGSRTWVAATGPRAVQVSGPTTNIFTGSGEDQLKDLQDLLCSVLRSADLPATDVDCVFVAHGAAATHNGAEEFADRLAALLAAISVRARLIVTSDMVPVVASEDGESVVAAIAGTGTVYVAHRRLARWARASGVDYLLSDEGGGFDLARNGLRAAVRATDGRGPGTDLVARARAWAAVPGDARLGDALYEHVYIANPRTVVADFARAVLDSARVGDDVALSLVGAAADEIVCGMCAVAEQVGIAGECPQVVLSGSLATVDSPLRRAILRKLDDRLSPGAVIDYEPQALATRAGGLLRLFDGEGGRLDGLRAILPIVMRNRP